jgi:hypothetical protein
LVIRAERLISFEDSRVKLVFEVVFACTTLGRGVQWFNAEDAEGEEETEEGGKRGHAEDQSTGGRQEEEEGNLDGQEGQDGDGEVGEEWCCTWTHGMSPSPLPGRFGRKM